MADGIDRIRSAIGVGALAVVEAGLTVGDPALPVGTVHATADRDRSDRAIMITGIGDVITRIGPS
jgi:hypothetical protein